MTARSELSTTLASGLAGWLQLNVTQRLGTLSGEDSARLILAQILNASGKYLPKTSQKPTNWGTTKKRVDLALLPRNAPDGDWYGVVETKWPGSAFDPHATRNASAQDAVRLAFVATNNLNAKLFVLGGSREALKKLFDTPHKAKARESRRQAFTELFSRDENKPNGTLNLATASTFFTDIGERVPLGVFQGFSGKLTTQLLAVAHATIGTEVHGSVYVWQCNQARGRRPPGKKSAAKKLASGSAA